MNIDLIPVKTGNRIILMLRNIDKSLSVDHGPPQRTYFNTSNN